MPQIVKAHMWRPRLFQQGHKLFTKTTSVKIVSIAVTKHQTMIFPDCTSPQTRPHLAHIMLFQCFQYKSREDEHTLTANLTAYGTDDSTDGRKQTNKKISKRGSIS